MAIVLVIINPEVVLPDRLIKWEKWLNSLLVCSNDNELMALPHQIIYLASQDSLHPPQSWRTLVYNRLFA